MALIFAPEFGLPGATPWYIGGSLRGFLAGVNVGLLLDLAILAVFSGSLMLQLLNPLSVCPAIQKIPNID